MVPSPVTLSPSDRSADALRLMRERNVRRIPLVDDGRVMGMVTLPATGDGVVIGLGAAKRKCGRVRRQRISG